MGSRYDRRSISPDNLSFASQALLALRPGLGSSFASWNARRLGAFARKTEHLPVPVVSVGNIAFGGTGKTPVTLSLARWLTERGRRVGVVASGHIGRLRKEGALVSDGGHVFLDVPQVGEEAVLLARALRELRIPVAAGAPRGDLARQLIDRHGV
ncbi:MAG TPA: tetraacyldisaccharide 4'-kinase, partial [bacterium]|nr:tetraacyldisaccharide 4'-kinase [bacterium]